MLFEESITSATSEGGSVAPVSFPDLWERITNFFINDDGTGTGTGYLVRIGLAIAVILVGYLIIKLIMFGIKKAMGIRKKGPDIDISAKWFIASVIKFFLWVGVAFLVVGILNINVTGIAGVASAITVALGLALQDIISCFASGVIILHQKHILTGDFVSIQNSLGTAEGTITRINFLLTYLKTPNGQEVTIPNNNVQKAIVTNYTRLGSRRLNYDVGVAYDTDIEKAKQVLRKIVEGDKRVIPENGIEVYVYELKEYAVGLRLRVWTKVGDYWPLYNELSEKVLLAFRDAKIRIPSSTDIQVKNS